MTDKEVFKSMRDDIVEAKSRLEVQTSQHGVAALTTALTQANAALLLALTEPTDDAPAGVLPPEISRELMGQVVDEVFGGAIEDATVIEDIFWIERGTSKQKRGVRRLIAELKNSARTVPQHQPHSKE